MRKAYRLILLLLLIVSTIALGSVIFLISPHIPIQISLFSLPPIILFFPLIFIMLFSLITAISKRPIFGILVASGVIIYLLFRLFGLIHPLFLILLLALFFVLMLVFRKEKESNK